VAVNAARRRAIFLVGPSGSGKTTMAVRMALEIQRAQGLNVVIAGTDVNRAGAPQQLMAFGAASGLDVRLCYAPGELEEILADPDVDAVIVDTPGHNGIRRDRMAELDAFLQAARQRTVLLTLPATMKSSDLGEVVSAYSAVGIDGLVLTRCDETSHFGALAGVAADASIGVAFTTHSDQVSDAPVAGDNMALASAVMAAQWGTPGGIPASGTPSRAGTSRRRPLAKVG
jgi:flagellar biosynthesis protein FlhF